MRYIANIPLIRAGAERFAAASTELRLQANQLDRSLASLTEGAWSGTGAQSFENAADHIRDDIQASSDAFHRVASALLSLASQLEQVNHLRQQAIQLENRIHSLHSELLGADEYTKDVIRDQIASLRYRMNDFDRNADYLENSANHAAGNAFEGISSLTNRLHFGHATAVTDKMADFFGNLWNTAKDKVHKIGDEVEEVFEETTEFFEEKYTEAQEGGIFGAFVGLFEGLGKYLYETLEALSKQTPSYILSHPGETMDRAKAIFRATSHPDETKKAILEEIKGIPYELKIYWERDLLNGTSYTRMKAVGTGIGALVELFATEGLGRLARAEKSIDEGLRLADNDQNIDTVAPSEKVDEIETPSKNSNSLSIGPVPTRSLDPIADSFIYEQVIALRQRLPSDLKRSGNFGYAQVNIDSINKEFFAHSAINDVSDRGYDKLVGIILKPSPPLFDATYVPDKKGDEYLRDYDTEYKILNNIALQLGDNTHARGTIKLYTDRKPCGSCSLVIQEFKEKYQDVHIEILYNSDEKPLFKRKGE